MPCLYFRRYTVEYRVFRPMRRKFKKSQRKNRISLFENLFISTEEFVAIFKESNFRRILAQRLQCWSKDVPVENTGKTAYNLGKALLHIFSSESSLSFDKSEGLYETNFLVTKTLPETSDGNLFPIIARELLCNSQNISSAKNHKLHLYITLLGVIDDVNNSPLCILTIIKGLYYAKSLFFSGGLCQSYLSPSLALNYAVRLPGSAIRSFLDFWDIPLETMSSTALFTLYTNSFKNKQYADCIAILLDFRPYNDNRYVLKELLDVAPIELIRMYAEKEKNQTIRELIVNHYSMCQKTHKVAMSFLKQFSLNIENYPLLQEFQELKIVAHFIHASHLDATRVLGLFEGNPRLINKLIQELLRLYMKKPSKERLIDVYYAMSKITNEYGLDSNLSEYVHGEINKYPSFDLEYNLFQTELNNIPTFPLSPNSKVYLSSQMLAPGSLNLEDLSYTLSKDLIWIDTFERLNCFLELIETQEKCVAIDSEWRPKFNGLATTSTALLQIACLNDQYIYLLDLFTLGNSSCERLGKFFRDSKLVKIGFSFMQNDWKELRLKSAEHFTSVKNYWEFTHFFNNKTILNAFEFKDKQLDMSQKSLAHMTQLILGHTMDKSLQLTNWESRPLPLAAACYAALDVAVLIRMLEKIMHKTAVKTLGQLGNMLQKLNK